MSLADIIAATPQKFEFANQVEVPGVGIAGLLVISVDVTISEEYTFANEITTNPVEKGIDVVDHKRPKPRVIRMSGIVTDSPNDLLDVVAGNTAGIPGTLQQKRSQDAYKTLSALAGSTAPLKIITHIDVFDNMTIDTISFRKNDAGEFIGFDCVIIELRFAETSVGAVVDKSVAHTAPAKPKAHVTPTPLPSGSVLTNSIIPALVSIFH